MSDFPYSPTKKNGLVGPSFSPPFSSCVAREISLLFFPPNRSWKNDKLNSFLFYGKNTLSIHASERRFLVCRYPFPIYGRGGWPIPKLSHHQTTGPGPGKTVGGFFSPGGLFRFEERGGTPPPPPFSGGNEKKTQLFFRKWASEKRGGRPLFPPTETPTFKTEKNQKASSSFLRGIRDSPSVRRGECWKGLFPFWPDRMLNWGEPHHPNKKKQNNQKKTPPPQKKKKKNPHHRDLLYTKRITGATFLGRSCVSHPSKRGKMRGLVKRRNFCPPPPFPPLPGVPLRGHTVKKGLRSQKTIQNKKKRIFFLFPPFL